MNFRALVVFFWVWLIGTAAVAGEERQMHIEIAVNDDVAGEHSFVNRKTIKFDGMPDVDDMHGRHEVRIIKKEVDVTN